MDDIQNENIDDLLLREDSVKLEFEALSEIKMTKKQLGIIYYSSSFINALCIYIIFSDKYTREI
ncbi:hypothetical protein DXB96_15210 [Clostridium sp. OM07-10AC]|nr:hypothetical protein DXB96_15210 [Clostridium sp. OM07-10AC]